MYKSLDKLWTIRRLYDPEGNVKYFISIKLKGSEIETYEINNISLFQNLGLIK